jgi:hypothetical protein
MVVQDHWILDDAALMGEISSCLHGVDVNAVFDSSARDQVLAAKVHLSRRLDRRLLRLDAHVRHNFVWAACRDNIHSFAQILALVGQLPKYVAASSTDEQLLLPDPQRYHRPMEGHPNDAPLEGVGVYIDSQRCKPVRSVLAHGRSFQKIHSDDEKSSKKPSSRFTKRYPFRPPLHPELGGWNGTFASLTLCIGIGIKSGGNNDCLLRPDGAFVWSDRTCVKLGNDKEKRMRFLLQMLQLFYALMIGRDAAIDGTPFQQYLGPVRT